MSPRLPLIVLSIILGLFAFATAREKLATGAFNLSGAPTSVSPAAKNPPSATRPPPVKISTLEADAPPSRKTWGNPNSLADHFARHGADFRAKDAEEYARLAWQFGQRSLRGGLLVKVDEDGVRRVFDSGTGAFGAYNENGTTKTFFKPNRPSYFARQPGRAPHAP